MQMGIVPEGASPPPEPPPKDYVARTNLLFGNPESGDDKIRARIEACKQGMMQLDALRSKHHRLMQEMRGRLPPIPGCVDVQTRIKRSTNPILDRSSLQSDDSGIITSQTVASRCSSPSISHRSSVSCDSGCSSVYSSDLNNPQPTMPYSTYRKLSVEDRGTNIVKPTRDSYPSPLEPNPVPIVATTIASTTCLRSDGVTKNWRRKQQQQRPRSMYDRSSTECDDSLLDSVSFSQITPPPVHRKFGIAHPPPINRSPLTPIRFPVNSSPTTSQRPLRTPQKPDQLVQARAVRVQSPDAVFHASRVFVEQSPQTNRRMEVPKRRIRPHSLFEKDSFDDQPLYATPARVLVKDRTFPSFASSVTPRRSAFTPVVSRSNICEQAKPRIPPRVVAKEWKESEGL